MGKLDGKMIKTLLTTCDLPTTGTKAANVSALSAFLLPRKRARRRGCQAEAMRRTCNVWRREPFARPQPAREPRTDRMGFYCVMARHQVSQSR